MTDTTKIKCDIGTKLWVQLKDKFPDLEEDMLLTKIITDYLHLAEIVDDDDVDILSELGDQKKLAESLRKKCKNFALTVKELEDTQADQEGEIQKLKKQNKKLSKGIPGFDTELPVKEKIVYREDTKTINELKEKRDALQKTVWEKNAELDRFEKLLNESRQSIEAFESVKARTYGFLVRLILNKQTSKYQYSFEPISRGEFNKLMRSKVEFCKYKKVFTPASVIKFWDTEKDESEIISLDGAVQELRTKSEVKLTEISLPYTEYEGLKNIEKNYTRLKEEFEILRSNLQQLEDENKQLHGIQEQLTAELTHLKQNPIVKEKIVYKENRKELEELNSECERLRLKLFNFETGNIDIPTHGINVGDLYRVSIQGVGKDGDGFTKVNNFIIFVPNTHKDQEVNIAITRVLKKYAFGKIVEGEPDGKVVDTTSPVSGGGEPIDSINMI